MESITNRLCSAILDPVPFLDLSPLPGMSRGKLRLTPEQLLAIIHAQKLAEWSLRAAARLQPPRLNKGPGGRPATYQDSSILQMAVVQVVWRKSYEQIVDYVAIHRELARTLGFAERTISQGQYWQRRADLGILPFLFFFLALVAQLIRLGVIRGQELVVDSILLSDRRMFRVVHDILGAHPAIHYNLRKAGKKKLATLEFLEQWQRLVTAPRTAIERHFAWMKRYFGLKYFQCFTLVRVMQFVQLTYIAALAVALAAERYQRPDLYRRRSMVLAHV